MSKSTTPNFSHLIGLPDDFSSPQIEDAVALIREGCAVATDDLRRELGRAHFVAHIYSGNRLAAVGAIKRQRPGYAKDVADRAHFSFPTEWRELGYVSVDKLFRRQGLSSRIVQLLMLNYSEDMFATTYSPYMKRTLQ